MWESSGRPWVGFLSTEDWGLELEISELCESYGDGNLEGRQTTYPRSHTKVVQDKGQKETGLVSSRAFLFLSPTELCLSKGFTPKEAKSSSDPLIPPPSTSSPGCELHGSQPSHPPGLPGSSTSLHA